MSGEDLDSNAEFKEVRPSVAVVTDAIYPFHRGGKEIRYFELLPRLGASFDVQVYTMHWWPESASTRCQDGIRYQAICPLFSLYNDVRRSTIEAIVFAVSALRLLTKRFDAVEADHMPYLHIFTLRLVAWIRRVPLIVTWNEVWGEAYWREYLGRIRGSIAWWIERSAMSLPDQILAVSEGTADRLRQYVGGSIDIRVIQNAIDMEAIRRVAPASSRESAELLYVGRLLEHKRVDLLIDAFNIVRDHTPCRLLVVGDGPEKGKLEKRVADAGLADHVRFRSDVSDHSDVFALMKAASVFVFPSVREGFGIAPLEALACGTHVVAVSHPDNQARHLVARSNRGYLCEASADELASSIEAALVASALEQGTVEAWVEEYDWAVISEAYVDALSAAIAERVGRVAERDRVA